MYKKVSRPPLPVPIQDLYDVFDNYIREKANKAGVKVENTEYCSVM